jgi:hypothetical protein
MKEKELVTFHFDGLQILLADQKNVFIAGNYGFYSDDKPCIIMMKRKLFYSALKEWIDLRAEYNKNNAYGAGFTQIEDYKDLYSRKIFKGYWEDFDCDDKNLDIEVPVIEALEYYNEMEHG